MMQRLTKAAAEKALGLLASMEEEGDVRATVLLSAALCVLKDRNSSYGEPEDNFRNIAEAQAPLPGMVLVSPFQVAMQGIAQKMGRLRFNRLHWDSWVDWVGYICCAADVLQAEVEREMEAELGSAEEPTGMVSEDGAEPEFTREELESFAEVYAAHVAPGCYELAQERLAEKVAAASRALDHQLILGQEPTVERQGASAKVTVPQLDGGAFVYVHQCAWPERCDRDGCQRDCKRQALLLAQAQHFQGTAAVQSKGCGAVKCCGEPAVCTKAQAQVADPMGLEAYPGDVIMGALVGSMGRLPEAKRTPGILMAPGPHYLRDAGLD